MNNLASLLKKASSTVFCFEFLFVLFLFAGRYKMDPRFQWVPIDLTLLFFIVSFAVGILIFLANGHKIARRPAILLMLYVLFLAYVSTSLVWSTSNDYAWDKAVITIVIGTWTLAAPALIIGRSIDRLKRLGACLILVALWFTIESFIVYFSVDRSWVISALGSDYLGIGRVVGLGALVVLAYGLFWTHSALSRIASFSIFFVFLALLILAGGRGPLIATVSAVIVPLAFVLQSQGRALSQLKSYAFLLLTVLVLGAGFILYTGEQIDEAATVQRILELDDMRPASSTGIRVGYMTATVNLWKDSPVFGKGYGSWPVQMGYGDVKNYPHNIVVELLAELGLVGLLLFVVVIVYGLVSLASGVRIKDSYVKMLILMLFVNTVANAMVSSDFPDNRYMLAVLGLMCARSINKPAQAHPRNRA